MSGLTYERAKQLYAPYDADQMRHLCALRDIEIERLRDENAKLREQTELLVTLLRNDCDIEASWDGLRHFWSIELTDDGCLMRDRACKAEAENAKLRELDVRMFHTIEWSDRMSDSMYWPSFSYKRELRELGIEVD